MKFQSDEVRFATIRENLSTSAVSDALDRLGFRHQVMRHDIKPLHPDHVVIGRARTWLWIDVDEIDRSVHNLAKALDSLKPGDVCIHNTSYSLRSATFGDIFAFTAQKQGCTGAIIDRLVRDIKEIIALGFPLFARGAIPTAAGGRNDLAELDVPVSCGDVIVHPGQLVYGDSDGVVVIPRDVEDEVISKSLEKIEAENVVRKRLSEGKTFQQVVKYYLSSGRVE